MQIETLKDLLHWARKCHVQLKDCLQHCGDTAENERVRLLLHYLADHEEKLAKALVAFEEQADLGALNTWSIEYIEKQPALLDEVCATPMASLSPAEIIQSIVQQHENILTLYRHLESRLPRGRAQQLMYDLAEMEHHESMQMVKNQQLLEDI
jgi:hypothetical protein